MELANILRRFQIPFYRYLEIISSLDDRVSKDLNSQEEISRFIFYSKHISGAGVNFGAFEPRAKGPHSDEVSVYRTTALTGLRVRQIGERMVEVYAEKKMKGRAITSVANVVVAGLKIVSDQKPHKRHANIMGWSSGKSERKMAAVRLAEGARFESYDLTVPSS